MIGLTEPQRRVWRALLEERKLRGRIGSRKTLQRKLGFRTRQALDNCLKALVNKQYIEGGWGTPIRILIEDERDELPERARQIRDYMRKFAEENGRVPTRKQMAKAAGLRSRGSLAPYLKALVEAQVIVIDENGIVRIRNVNDEEVPVLDAKAEVPPGAQLIEASRIVGRVSATVANLFEPRPSLFLRSDDSLRTLGVDAGDLVAITTGAAVEDGQIVVARIQRRLGCRRLHRIDEDLLELRPVDADGNGVAIQIERAVEHVYIEGVVIGALVAKPIKS